MNQGKGTVMSRSVGLTILLVAGSLQASGGPAEIPQPVSPVGLVELSCPTFSWSSVAGVAGHELVVYVVKEDGEVGEAPILSASLPGGASSWTPSGRRCLPPGESFAWSLRILGEEGPEGWSAPALFEVAATPGAAEVEAALATLHRYLAESREAGSERPDRQAARSASARTSAALVSITSAAAPALGTPSLSLDAGVALGAASNLFKDGSVFLWDDTAGNTALGRSALASATGTATRNTAVGTEALRSTVPGAYESNGSSNTAVGYRALFDNTTGWSNSALGREALGSNGAGSFNTASGDRALFSNTSGHRNTAMGARALYSNTSGTWNTAIGAFAHRSNVTGSKNTVIGYRALRDGTGDGNVAIGYNAGLSATDGDDNIYISHPGGSEDSGTIRIGAFQNQTYIVGIHGSSVGGTLNEMTVLVDSSGKLGTQTSSRRFKEAIADLGEVSERLLELRPVRFRYKEQEGEGPEQYGLLAEQVAEVFPELVVEDEDGEPYSVRYHVMVPLLLNEIQRQQARITALEERRSAAEDKRRWWRRMFSQ